MRKRGSGTFWHVMSLVCTFAIGSLMLGVQPATAQGTCIQDVWKAHGNSQNLTCTAKDVRLANVTNIDISAGGSCTTVNGVKTCKCNAGGNVTFTADFEMPLTADTRYDVGLYLATDGGGTDGALTGQCSANIVTVANAPNTFVQLDDASNAQSGDACGDITGPLGTAHNPQIVHLQVTTKCEDTNNDQKLNLPWCTTWRQPGANALCTSVNDAYPGSPSKCNCGNLDIDIRTETPGITVTKTADTDPSTTGDQDTILEPGGPVTYKVKVHNDSQFTNITLEKICDDHFGTIAVATGKTCPTGSEGSLTKSNNTCGTAAQGAGTLPATISPGGDYICQFTVDLSNVTPKLNAGDTHTNTVCAAGTANGNPVGGDTPTNPLGSYCDPADVKIANVLPSASGSKTATALLCAIVRYKVEIKNEDTVDPLTISNVSDNKFGNITITHKSSPPVEGDVVATTCSNANGTVLQPSGSVDQNQVPTDKFSCTFDGVICRTDGLLTLSMPKHTNSVTATLTDNDGASCIWPANPDPNSLVPNCSSSPASGTEEVQVTATLP